MAPRLLIVAAVVALALAPAVLAAYPLFIFSYMLVFAIACLALNLLYGTAGSLSLGHATFFGVAAYAGAFLYRFTNLDSFELYLLVGVATSTLFAAVIGLFCVRASKIQFAILTLSLCMVLYSVVIDGAVFRLFGGIGWALYLLGGGAMYMPPLRLLGMQFSGPQFIPVLYYVIAAALVVCCLMLFRIDRSPFGQALKAIRENETRAVFIGIPVIRYRWYAFVLSGLFMGIAGGLYGQLARQITPEQLDWVFSAKLVLATVLGGTRRFLGPVIGAFVFVGLDEMASQWPLGRNTAMGLLIIVVVLAFPRGIAGGLSDWIEWKRPSASG